MDGAELSRQSSRILELEQYLTNVICLPPKFAKQYAEKLCEDGFDSVELFDKLTKEQLMEEYGFARGRALKVELSQQERGVGRFATPRLEEGVPPAPHPSPEPAPLPEDRCGGYTTCIDRPYIQKEIRWARQYGKPIITVVEADSHRPGHFDFEKARSKYDVPCTCGQTDETGHKEGCEREWKFLLDISAIDFERNVYKEDGMVRHILDAAGRLIVDELPAEGDHKTCPAHRDGALNPPGWWHFFLSHNQV